MIEHSDLKVPYDVNWPNLFRRLRSQALSLICLPCRWGEEFSLKTREAKNREPGIEVAASFGEHDPQQ